MESSCVSPFSQPRSPLSMDNTQYTMTVQLFLMQFSVQNTYSIKISEMTQML